MSKFKKVLSLILVVAVTAGIAITGTMAYLTSEDSDVNVMTLGNVKIAQHEYQRATDENGEYKTDTIDDKTSYVLEAFEQAKPLLPIVGDPSSPEGYPSAGYDETIIRMTQVDSYGSVQVFAGKNAQDKIVTVENTGRSDAYVRTLVAIEVGDLDDLSLLGTMTRSQAADATGTQPWIETEIGTVNINGNNYYVYEYVYRGASDVNRHLNGVLPAGDTTYPNLCQVYIGSDATNEDIEKWDGNDNGTLDILVLSQAIQAAGFSDAQTALDTGFGDVNAANVQAWFGSTTVPTTVSTADELDAALAAGEDVVLTEDVTTESTTSSNLVYGNSYGTYVNGGTLDGSGNTISAGEGVKYTVVTTGGTITNVTVDSGERGIVTYAPTEDVVIDNVVVNGPGYALNSTEHAAVKLIVKNTTLNGWTSFAGFESASFTNCKFGMNTTKYWQNMGYDADYDRLIKPYVNTTFTGCEFEKEFCIDLSALGADCTVTLTDCTCDDVELTAENYADYITIDLPSGRNLADCMIFN